MSIGKDKEHVYLVEATPFDQTQTHKVVGLPPPVGVQPLNGPISFDVPGGEIAVYVASKPYRTGPTETPPNQLYEGVLIEPYSTIATLFELPEPAGASRAGFGDVVALNGKGNLDTWRNYFWDGREVKILAGSVNTLRANMSTIFRGTADSIRWDEETISIRLRDRRALFNRPFQTNLYTGAGLLEGGADLKGHPKPLGYGDVFNAVPILIDASTLVYQVHDGQVESIEAVRDKGIELTDRGNVADVFTATVSAGTFVKNVSAGVLRIGVSVAGDITVNFKGDARDGIYASSADQIVKRIVKTRIGGDSLSDADLVTADFTALNTAQPAAVNFYAPRADGTVAGALDDVMGNIGGWWDMTRDGLLTVGRLVAPSSSVVTYSSARILPPIEINRIPPSFRRRIGYKQNYFVQSQDDLAAGVSAANVLLFGSEFRFALAQDTTVRAKHRLARDVETNANFVADAAASTEADRLLTLHKVDREIVRVGIQQLQYNVWLGDDVTLQIGRFGLTSGKTFTVIGVEENAFDETATLLLWG